MRSNRLFHPVKLSDPLNGKVMDKKWQEASSKLVADNLTSPLPYYPTNHDETGHGNGFPSLKTVQQLIGMEPSKTRRSKWEGKAKTTKHAKDHTKFNEKRRKRAEQEKLKNL